MSKLVKYWLEAGTDLHDEQQPDGERLTISPALKSQAVYLADDVDALLEERELKWTHEKPTEPGWWWWRNVKAKHEDDREAIIYKVRDYAGKLAIGNCEIDGSSYVQGQWSGPIPPPGE